ncbi:MAG: hypothetical protein ACT4P2_03845 [Pseudomonadota bacterium]
MPVEPSPAAAAREPPAKPAAPDGGGAAQAPRAPAARAGPGAGAERPAVKPPQPVHDLRIGLIDGSVYIDLVAPGDGRPVLRLFGPRSEPPEERPADPGAASQAYAAAGAVAGSPSLRAKA